MPRLNGINPYSATLAVCQGPDEDDVFDEKTGVYDEAFLRTSNCVVDYNGLDKKEQSAETAPSSIEQMRDSSNEELSDATKFNYILPKRFEHGDHMETYLVHDRPLSIGLLSNATFKDIEPSQQARLGVAAARFSDQRIDFTMLNFDIEDHAQALSVPNLLLNARQKGNIDQAGAPEGLMGSLKVTISPKEKTIDCVSSHNASPCYLIRGRSIYEMTKLGKQELQSGDIVLILTGGIIDALVKQVTKKAYQEVVPALKAPNEQTMMSDLPTDFVEQETANQIHGLITSSQFDTYVNQDGEKIKQRRLSPQMLFKVLTAIYHKEQKNNPKDEIVTDAFAVYQLP